MAEAVAEAVPDEQPTVVEPPEPAPEPSAPAPAADTAIETPPVAEPAEPLLPSEPPTFLDRGRIRRRARYLRRLREIQLRDIGGFMLELNRFGRQRPDLVAAKLTGAADTDRELRALERALGQPVPLSELREAGIGGACAHCGAVYGSGDRFCAWCGSSVHRPEQPDTPVPEEGDA